MMKNIKNKKLKIFHAVHDDGMVSRHCQWFYGSMDSLIHVLSVLNSDNES